jgi:hypothetical protein
MSATRPPVVTWLGYGGLLPFVFAVAAIALDPHHGLMWLDLQQSYGAVILAFVGALHWGVAMHMADDDRKRNAVYVWSVMPALLAWVATQVSGLLAALILVSGFALHYLKDWSLNRQTSLPGWYLPLRLQLTVVASLSLLAGALLLHL